MSTPKHFFEDELAQNLKKMTPRWEDGLIIAVLKLFFHGRVWNWPYRFSIWILLLVSGNWTKSTERPDIYVRVAADIYMVIMGTFLILCYFQEFALAARATPEYCPMLSAMLWLVFPVFRVIESVHVIVMLHANGPYDSPAPMRAVSKMLWAYLEFVVAFASIYLAITVLTGDKFGAGSDPGFLASWVHPLYFSMITIATVGYGDFAPQTSCGRFIVIIEVFCGLLLLVVVLQRVLAVSIPEKTNRRARRMTYPKRLEFSPTVRRVKSRH
ncbi:MAG: potassium channel family protein [Pirellulaceae bacterium]